MYEVLIFFESLSRVVLYYLPPPSRRCHQTRQYEIMLAGARISVRHSLAGLLIACHPLSLKFPVSPPPPTTLLPAPPLPR